MTKRNDPLVTSVHIGSTIEKPNQKPLPDGYSFAEVSTPSNEPETGLTFSHDRNLYLKIVRPTDGSKALISIPEDAPDPDEKYDNLKEDLEIDGIPFTEAKSEKKTLEVKCSPANIQLLAGTLTNICIAVPRVQALTKDASNNFVQFLSGSDNSHGVILANTRAKLALKCTATPQELEHLRS